MHHYCSKFQWWMAGSLINCLLILSHHWAMEIFLPTSKDLLWQLEQEAVAFWASQQRILTKSHHILSSSINVVFLFPEGGYFLLSKGIENSLYVILKEMLRAPNCRDWHLTSYSLSGQKRNWEIWTFHSAVWGALISNLFESARPSLSSCVNAGGVDRRQNSVLQHFRSSDFPGSDSFVRSMWQARVGCYFYVIPFGFWSISRIWPS